MTIAKATTIKNKNMTSVELQVRSGDSIYSVPFVVADAVSTPDTLRVNVNGFRKVSVTLPKSQIGRVQMVDGRPTLDATSVALSEAQQSAVARVGFRITL